MSSLEEALAEIRKTNVTNTIHREPYPAISSTRPELSQAGRVVLITGGGTGVGFAIARAFVRASAATVIIVGRRADVLESARSRLEEEVKASGTNTKIITKTCDIVNVAEVEALWKNLGAQGIFVDVYVANAAKFTDQKPMLELGTEDVWSQLETNVRSPLHFAEKFHAQPGKKQKFIVNVSTGSIHAQEHPEVVSRPAYTLSKLSGTLLFQLLAQDYPHEDIQILSFHPGLIFNETWKALGLNPDQVDSDELTGAFAVWAASKQAAFLHGRFVWCSWDVEELATGVIRKRIDEDFYFLKTSVVGLKSGLMA
ncbi:NAD(P)-binding protein [Cucurbitaria berberidis CBS 394.84]|uniref:NAD(P)-binding protein n=1 Tax=Cucurbitaria berberidis CBS 394.84 TaxID=1168544 RepID=A0A9P4GFD0_9PLEO|nr:NAD(P)-binding protein [Cucurbitaria berberidis CBS 394.84]KAF1844424.1 NAD(P)-binding protein [Cucurbitaria berberidis CBS 394.84]